MVGYVTKYLLPALGEGFFLVGINYMETDGCMFCVGRMWATLCNPDCTGRGEDAREHWREGININ